MLEAFLGVDEVTDDPAWAATLRRVFASGEALPAELAAPLDGRSPAVPLHNLYGPTEAAVDVTWHDPALGMPAAGTVPIGRPVWNTGALVLDALPAARARRRARRAVPHRRAAGPGLPRPRRA